MKAYRNGDVPMAAWLSIALLSVALLTAAGCELLPTPTPVRTPTPTYVLATRLEEIVGTWEGIGGATIVQRFSADGTCVAGITLERLESGPDAQSTCRFEGTRFVITQVEAAGLRPCQAGAEIGTYEVRLLPNGNIKFDVLEDKCARRRRSMILEHEPVR